MPFLFIGISIRTMKKLIDIGYVLSLFVWAGAGVALVYHLSYFIKKLT